jgi:acid phosphatase (class A)
MTASCAPREVATANSISRPERRSPVGSVLESAAHLTVWVWLIAVLALSPNPPASAAEATFVTPNRFDLTKLLPPAPAPESEQQRLDLDAVLKAQATRTASQSERALADATAGTFGFADVLGPNFNAERVPAVAALLDKARGDAVVAFSAGKGVWNRPRPFVVSTAVDPVGDRPEGSSYPSGASTVGYLTAIILANMVPEKSAALFARGREFGDDRVILGVHFPSDVEAGRLAATGLAAMLMQDAAFLKEFAGAQSELRQALGLPPKQ